MKKFISAVLALTMIATLGLASFAVDLNADKPDTAANEVIVKTSKYKDPDGGTTDPAEEYTVTIPALNVIPWGSTSTELKYGVDAHLEWNHLLTVTVTADHDEMTFTTPGGKTYPLAYALDGDNLNLSVGPVENDPIGTDTGKVFTVEIAQEAWDAAPVAEYQDTLTFATAVVTDANA